MGNPIAHSLSPHIHSLFAKQTNVALIYEKLLIEEQRFESAVHQFFLQGGQGLNITLPFKQRAFVMSAVKTDRCHTAGAANTLWIKESKLYADNTDGVGLITDLERYTAIENKKILILGAGGATRGILTPLFLKSPKTITVANRTWAKAEELQKEFPFIHISPMEQLEGEYDLILNAISMRFDFSHALFSKNLFKDSSLCYDLSYNLERPTPFVALAKSSGCEVRDGLGMLVEQAAESFFIWNGIRPDTNKVLRELNKIGPFA